MATVQDRADPQPRLKGIPRLEWHWIALVCLLLGASGAYRYVRDWQFYSVEKENERAPFPLTEIPENLGSWRAIEGSESVLEPEIAQVAGANDHLIRTYVDGKTGETAVVMILHGLAYRVWPHSPAACYPSQGFATVTPSRDRNLPITVPGSSTPALFLEQHFSKSSAGQVDYRVVYHSFLNSGHWRFDVGKDWKSFRYHPGMFKVQVQRSVGTNRNMDENAIEDLLAQIVKEIDRRLRTPS
jgi:hypothetical protein